MQPYSTQLIQEDDIASVIEALKSPLITQGHLTQALEDALCKFCNSKYALVFNSATSALYATYKSLNLEKHEVITTPISFVATTNMLLQNNATPVFCDIGFDGNIDPLQIPTLISPCTKAIVSVDYGGKSVEVEAIQALCKKYNLFFISDSSHSIGSMYKDKKIGSLADATIFSFHPVKPMTTIEGGALLTNNDTLYKSAKLIRAHGVIKKDLWHYDVVDNGFNFRINEIQAALGLSQLKKLSTFIQRREEIAKIYDMIFHHNPYFETLHKDNPYTSSNHLYPILLFPKFHKHKTKIFKLLQKEGLGVQVHYRPIYQFSYYKKLYPNLMLPQAENFYHSQISIPCHHKMTQQIAEKIAEKVLKVLSKI